MTQIIHGCIPCTRCNTGHCAICKPCPNHKEKPFSRFYVPQREIYEDMWKRLYEGEDPKEILLDLLEVLMGKEDAIKQR